MDAAIVTAARETGLDESFLSLSFLSFKDDDDLFELPEFEFDLSRRLSGFLGFCQHFSGAWFGDSFLQCLHFLR